MGSFDALKSATASVPIKTDMLRYETQAIQEKKAPKIKETVNQSVDQKPSKQHPSERQENKRDNILRSFANHTLLSTLTGVGVFLGTRTCDGAVVIE